MNVDKKVKRLGIEKLYEVEEQQKKKLANLVSNSLIENFKNSRLNKERIEKKLLDAKMYIANIPEDMSKANYIYVNSSIYFDKSLNLEELDEFILHECIHKIQEYKDNRNRLIQLGTCNFATTKIIGLAFNEASIEYIISKILKNKKTNMKVYGINVPSISGKYYSLITNLIEQIAYLIGEEILVDSTINCNHEFIYKCIDDFGEKNFYRIRDSFDKILLIQDTVSRLQIKNKEKLQTEIEHLKNIYFETQELIITSYFDLQLKIINSSQELENYKQKLLDYKKLIVKIDNYEFMDKYYEAQYLKVLEKEQKIKDSTALIIVNNNLVFKAFRALKNYLLNQKGYNK